MKKKFLVALIIFLLSSCTSPDQKIDKVKGASEEVAESEISEESTVSILPTKTAIPNPTPTEDVWETSLTELPVLEGGVEDLPEGYSYIPTNCEMKNNGILMIPPSSEFGLRFGWGTKEEEQMEEFLQSVRIELSIDGQPVKYDGRTSTVFDEQSSIFIVWLYKIIGNLDLGLHLIEQKMIFEDEYSDGFETFGQGTEKEVIIDTCEFLIGDID